MAFYVLCELEQPVHRDRPTKCRLFLAVTKRTQTAEPPDSLLGVALLEDSLDGLDAAVEWRVEPHHGIRQSSATAAVQAPQTCP
jgi:hypothetical protein